MKDGKLGVALIGCGNIAQHYAADLKNYPEIEFLGATDLDLPRAEALTAQHGGAAYPSVEVLLADPAIDLAVNLTTFNSHYAINKQILSAGKHAYSEKPLSMAYSDAQDLVAFAAQKGLRLGCSPFTLIGEPQQTAWKLIREGRAGKIRAVYAEANQGRIEVWHPAPIPFYAAGIVPDVGVYPITLLVTMLGAARRVTAYAKVLKPDRVTKDGQPYSVETPEWVLAALELADGTVARLTMTFYVTNRSKQFGLEFHGDLGSIFIGQTYGFDTPVEFAPYGQDYEPVPLVRPGSPGIPWARGVAEMAEAIIAGRPHRFTGELAAHVCEILDAIKHSYTTGQPVDIHSSFPPPAPMEWAE